MDLTKSNEQRQIHSATRLQPSSTLPCSRSLDACTETATARAQAKTRPQKHHAVALGVCRNMGKSVYSRHARGGNKKSDNKHSKPKPTTNDETLGNDADRPTATTGSGSAASGAGRKRKGIAEEHPARKQPRRGEKQSTPKPRGPPLSVRRRQDAALERTRAADAAESAWNGAGAT